MLSLISPVDLSIKFQYRGYNLLPARFLNLFGILFLLYENMFHRPRFAFQFDYRFTSYFWGDSCLCFCSQSIDLSSIWKRSVFHQVFYLVASCLHLSQILKIELISFFISYFGYKNRLHTFTLQHQVKLFLSCYRLKDHCVVFADNKCKLNISNWQAVF